jgi:hypothetical protein
MSYNSWTNEFYQISAAKIAETGTDQELVQNCLTKWTGLLPENLEKHNVYLSDGDVVGNASEPGALSINSESCALCKRFLYTTHCTGCPIYLTQCRDCIPEYCKFEDHNNPRPMIRLLTRVLERVKPKDKPVPKKATRKAVRKATSKAAKI